MRGSRGVTNGESLVTGGLGRLKPGGLCTASSSVEKQLNGEAGKIRLKVWQSRYVL